MFAAIFIVLVAFDVQSISASDGNDWSFLLHPAKQTEDLPHERLQKLFDTVRQFEVDGIAPCQVWVDELIKIYVETWPDFAFYASVPSWRQKWIDAFALSTYRKVVACAVYEPATEIWSNFEQKQNPTAGEPPFFCGQFTSREVPAEVGKSIRLLIRLAFEEDINSPAFQLFTGNFHHPNVVELNPDVAFYLFQRQSYIATKTHLLPTTQMMGTLFDFLYGKLDNVLTPERRAEVVAAARQGDAEAILSTTAPCRPYEAMKNSK